MPVPGRATTLGRRARDGSNGVVDEPDDKNAEVSAAVLDVVASELERCSALADELARLLLPARLFS